MVDNAVMMEKDDFYANKNTRMTDENCDVENEDGDTRLFLAIIHERSREALELIDRLVGYEKLYHANKLGQTALHLAVMTGDAEITRRLVVAGSPLHLKEGKRGDTPLHTACRTGRSDLVDAIIEPVRYSETKSNDYEIPYRKPPFPLLNFDGKTCLILACGKPNLRNIIRSLIVWGADIEDIDGKTGRNCFHTLAERKEGRRTLFETVLPNAPEAKVKKALRSPDWSGATPIDMVRRTGKIDIPYSFSKLNIGSD